MKKVKRIMDQCCRNQETCRSRDLDHGCLLQRLKVGSIQTTQKTQTGIELTSDNLYDAFFKTATIAALSLDPSTQVGASILDKNGQVVTWDYNHFPEGVNEYHDRLVDRNSKYLYMDHAEYNAILKYRDQNNGQKPEGLVMVATWAACASCASDIINHGIKTVYTDYWVYEFSHKHRSAESLLKWEKSVHVALDKFEEAGIEFITINNLPDYVYKSQRLDELKAGEIVNKVCYKNYHPFRYDQKDAD